MPNGEKPQPAIINPYSQPAVPQPAFPNQPMMFPPLFAPMPVPEEVVVVPRGAPTPEMIQAAVGLVGKRPEKIDIQARITKPPTVEVKYTSGEDYFKQEGILLVQETEIAKSEMFPNLKNEEERANTICNLFVNWDKKMVESLGYNVNDFEFGCNIKASPKKGMQIIGHGLRIKKDAAKKYQLKTD